MNEDTQVHWTGDQDAGPLFLGGRTGYGSMMAGAKEKSGFPQWPVRNPQPLPCAPPSLACSLPPRAAHTHSLTRSSRTLQLY